MLVEVSGIQIKIVYRLHRRGKYGGSHAAIEDAVRGFPSHLTGEVRDSLQDLMRLRLITSKPTSYGLRLALNVDRTDVIGEICNLYMKLGKNIEDRRVYVIEIA